MEIFPRWHKYTQLGANLACPSWMSYPAGNDHISHLKEHHRFKRGYKAGCLEGSFMVLKTWICWCLLYLSFKLLVLGSWKQPKIVAVPLFVMRGGHIERRANILVWHTDLVHSKQKQWPPKTIEKPWITERKESCGKHGNRIKIREPFNKERFGKISLWQVLTHLGVQKTKCQNYIVRMVLVNSYYTCFFLASTGKNINVISMKWYHNATKVHPEFKTGYQTGTSKIHCILSTLWSSWWFQPIWKTWVKWVKWDHFPNFQDET